MYCLSPAIKRTITTNKLKPYINSPTFSFDSDTFSTYNGRLGEYYTVTVGSGKDRHTETRTRYFVVSGTYSQFFNDVLIEVSPKLSQKEFDKWYYQYFVKENDLTYSVLSVAEGDVSAEEINPDDCYIRKNDLNYVLDLIKNGNYVIENGNVKLIDTEETKYYTKDSVRYYNGAVIFNVGTTEAKMLDYLENDDPIFGWRQRLHLKVSSQHFETT